VPAIDPDDLTLLRTHPHKIKEYLAVIRPATVLACRLDGAPTSDPVTEITYDNVAEGAFGNVVAGMTLWVGSMAGGRDKGSCRIRKAPTATILYIAEDSAVDWENDDYLTVVENYELWSKYPRIVVNEDITFYKDWEETYSDQHENWPPVAILGPPDCQFIDPDTGLATVKFVGERSYAVAPGATISSYAWTFPSGTPVSANTAGTEAAPHSVTWDTPGTYWISLTVTDSNGKIHTGRRPIFIFPQTGAGAPYTQFKLASRNASLDQHGHTAQFEIFGDADQAEFPDRALIVYFTEDWYGDTQKSIGGNFPYRSHIKFCGYIQKESTSKDPETGTVTFDVATINALMATREGFSCWITAVGDATTWTEATHLTADRAALSLCRHQSTVLDICDVTISGSTLKIKSQEFAAKTSLFQQLQSLYDDLFAHVACDKQGRLYFNPDPQMLSQANRASIVTVVALGHGDWRTKIDLPRPQEPKTSFINLGGVAYSGYPAEVEAILSKAPGDAPVYSGTARDINGLILAGQADGNEKAGLALAYDNIDYPEVPLPMAGNWDVFDIVPQEYVTFSLAAEDTKRGIVWVDQKLIPRRVELRFEETETGKAAMITIHVEKESYGAAGMDGDYPDDVPDVDPDITPPPPAPEPPPGGYEGIAGPAVASHDIDGVYWTDFMGESWQPINTGLGDTKVLDLIWDPWWFTEYRSGGRNPHDVILWACGQGFIERKDGTQPWLNITPQTDPPNTWSDTTPPTATAVSYKQLHGDMHNLNTFYALVEWQEPDSGLDKWRGWLAKTVDNGITWTWQALSQNLGNELVTNGTFDTSCANWNPCGEHGIHWTSSGGGRLWVGFRALSDTYTNQTVHVSVAGTYRLKATWDRANSTNPVRVNYAGATRIEWSGAEEGTKEAIFSASTGYYVLQLLATFQQVQQDPYGWFDNVSLRLMQALVDGYRPLAMDVDTEDGSRLYVTGWVAGVLVCQRYDSALSFQESRQFGSATEVEVADKTYFIVPRCPHELGGSGFGDDVWVFGRWNDGGVKHLAYSSNGGMSFADKGSGSWDSNHRLGAIDILYDGLTLHAFVNHASTPRLWRSPDQGGSWTDLNSVPFNVEFDAFTRCNWAADEFMIGRNGPGAQMAAWIESPYDGAWTDATGSPSLPTGAGAITAIIWVG